MKKVTKAQRFEDIKAILNGHAVTSILTEDGDCVPRTTLEDALAFCDGEIALLVKKNSSENKKPTKTQQENEEYKVLILGFLAGQSEAVTCTDILKGVPEFEGFSNQKIAVLVRQLADAGKVRKSLVKGKTLITLA